MFALIYLSGNSSVGPGPSGIGPGARARLTMKWSVYILLSRKDNERYIGSTSDLNRRLNEHNSGKVRSTKNRIPLELLYTEEYSIEKEARLREKFFKTHKGFNELRKILLTGNSSVG